MAFINLLPWREAQKKQQQTQFMTLLTAAGLVSFGVIFALSSVYSAQIEGQEYRNSFLQNEINILEQRIVEIRELEQRKKNLQKRMELIAQLQSSRNLGTQIMDEIATVVPAGVYLTNLQKQGPSLLLVGKSESNNRLSSLLRVIEQSQLLTQPVLEFIQASKDESGLLSDFKMHLRLIGAEPPPAPPEPAGKAKAGTQAGASK